MFTSVAALTDRSSPVLHFKFKFYYEVSK